VRHLTYLVVLAGCLICALWLEPLLRVGVLRRWRRLALTLAPVVAVFVAWDVAAIAAGHWSYDRGQILGVTLPGRLPVEELLFFIVVPLCAILGFEAVRRVTGWSARDGER
jgi:lycopene cyclase domain-containing protein